MFNEIGGLFDLVGSGAKVAMKIDLTGGEVRGSKPVFNVLSRKASGPTPVLFVQSVNC